MTIISKMISQIKPSPTLSVMKRAAELKAVGKDIISLGAGEPDFDTPIHIKQAAINAINEGFTKYTNVDGIPALKEAVIQKFSRDNSLSYNLKQVTIANGGKQIIYNALMSTINPGDEVIIPAPYWVSYPDIVTMAGGVPVFVQPSESNSFKVTADDIAKHINHKTKWIILNSPNNPSGAAYTKNELQAITNLLLEHEQIYIMSDDIYEHIVFDDFHFYSPAAVEPKLSIRTLTVNGVSKSYSMTGWRIGYCGGPEEIIAAMNIMQSQTTSNACSISQRAALAALNGSQDFLQTNSAIFQKRRNLVVNMLNDINGINCNYPEGAFYVLPNCSAAFGKKTPSGKILNNSSDVADYLLDQANVAVVSGIAFGIEGYFRISYATSEQILEEACKRMKEAFNKLS